MSVDIRTNIHSHTRSKPFVKFKTFVWPFGAWQTIPPSLMSAMTRQHWLHLLLPISQVKPFIALNDNVDISAL